MLVILIGQLGSCFQMTFIKYSLSEPSTSTQARKGFRSCSQVAITTKGCAQIECGQRQKLPPKCTNHEPSKLHLYAVPPSSLQPSLASGSNMLGATSLCASTSTARRGGNPPGVHPRATLDAGGKATSDGEQAVGPSLAPQGHGGGGGEPAIRIMEEMMPKEENPNPIGFAIASTKGHSNPRSFSKRFSCVPMKKSNRYRYLNKYEVHNTLKNCLAVRTMIEENRIKSRYQSVNQSHVFDYLDTLSKDAKLKFLEQLDSIKVEDLSSLLSAALNDQQNQDNDDITPFSKDVGRTTDKDEAIAAYAKGIEVIGRGEVAALVLAGGQGTRLGFAGPKGMYDIGLPSGRTLFQLLAERLKKLKKIADCESLPFYIMTSPINHEDTTAFFKENDYFGLPENDVIFFQQGMLPCMTNDGKIILESADKIAMAPDGNGGIYPSLKNAGMIDDMTSRGTKFIHVFSIDNALTKIADPIFIGHCVTKEADCGNKCVWKKGPHEKVGVIAEKANKPCIVEYSEITSDMAELTDADGRLVFGAGNICNHFYTLDFLKEKVIPNLGNLYHIARKKIPFYDETSKSTIKPESNNGIKLESFIFDIFPLSERMAVLDAERDQEFAPVKNAPGSASDSPDTARSYISKQAQKWVTEAGGKLTGDLNSLCEISPLTSYGGEGLEDLVKGKEIHCPFSL